VVARDVVTSMRMGCAAAVSEGRSRATVTAITAPRPKTGVYQRASYAELRNDLDTSLESAAAGSARGLFDRQHVRLRLFERIHRLGMHQA
jgi:hypothetical protein